jgi:hypothetical protein
MNKKVNTVLFVLGATLVNVLVMIVLVILGIMLIGLLPVGVQESSGQILLVLVMFLSIGITFFAYHRLIKLVSSKVDMDKYFHPIIKPRGRKPQQ